MPISGGAADKMGNQYENYWALHAMVRILSNNEVKSITIESVDENKTDFILQFESKKTEAWQIKRQTSYDYWTLSKLNSKGIFSFFKDQYYCGNIGVFASISDAPDLREILERAKHADSWTTFESLIKTSKDVNRTFDKICDFLMKQTPKEVFAIFKNSRLIHSDHEQLLYFIDCGLRSMFLEQDPSTIRSILFEYYLAQIHKTLDADDIFEHLKSKGIYSKEVQRNSLKKTIKNITIRYADYQKHRLISDQLIHRDITSQITDTILSASESVNIVILGEAGSGKSGVLYEVLQLLNQKEIPVLAFRMDLLEYKTTTQDLGKQLELNESPVMELQSAFRDEDIVLLVDQLDCMSTTSGRNSNFFETFYILVQEINNLRQNRKTRFHLIISCRKFDFDNDQRFSKLFDESDKNKSVFTFEVGKLSEQEVNDLLGKIHPTNSLTKKQVQLLTLPQNLFLYFACIQSNSSDLFDTQKDLFAQYWRYKKEILDKIGNYWSDVMEIMCSTMSERQELTISETKMNSIPYQYINTMCSEGVIIKDKKRFGFRHENFFDYCFVQQLLSKERDFIQDLENEFEEGQHLFRRSQLRQYVTYLRDDNFRNYIETVKRILESKNILSHLKFLILSLIVSWNDIRPEEWNIIKFYVLRQYENFRAQNTQVSSVESHAHTSFLLSPTLLLLEDVQNFIKENLTSSDSVCLNNTILFLQYQINNYPDKIAEILLPYLECGKNWQERINSVIQHIYLKDSRDLFDIFLRLLQLGEYDNIIDKDFRSIHIIYDIPPKWMIEVIVQMFQRILEISLPQSNYYDSPLHNEKEWSNSVSKVAQSEPQFFIDMIFPFIIPLGKKYCAKRCYKKFKHDFFWNTYSFERKYFGNINHNDITGPKLYIIALEKAFSCIFDENPEKLRFYIEELKKQHLYITNYLLLKIFMINPKYFANEAIELINNDPSRFSCDSCVSTVSKCSQLCDIELFRKIEATFSKCFLHDDNLHDQSLQALRALDESRLLKKTKKIIRDWQDEINHKLHVVKTPETILCETIFDDDAKLEFSNDEWLQLFRNQKTKNNTIDHRHLVDSFNKIMQCCPERFLNMVYNTLNIPASMIEAMLYDMNTIKTISDEEKYRFFCFTKNSNDIGVQHGLIDLLCSLESIDFKQDDIDYILSVAINAKTDEEESWKGESPCYGGDPLNCGLNTPRGKAIWRIYKLLEKNQDKYQPIIKDHLDQLISIESDSIAANVIILLDRLWHSEKELIEASAQKLFEKVHDRVLVTDISEYFLINLLYTNHEQFIPFITRLLDSHDTDLNKKGGELAARTYIFHKTKSAYEIFQKALKCNADSRRGIIVIAREALRYPEHIEFGVKILVDLFNDNAEVVRKDASFCFSCLSKSEKFTKPVETLFERFVDSRAFLEYSHELFEFLYGYELPLIGQSLKIIDRFVQFYVAGEIKDISQYSYRLVVDKLILRIYAMSSNMQDQNKALKLIDAMYENNLFDKNNFIEFER
jgi:hypothetical protein